MINDQWPLEPIEGYMDDVVEDRSLWTLILCGQDDLSSG